MSYSVKVNHRHQNIRVSGSNSILNSGVKIEVGWKFSSVNARGIAGQRAVRVRGGQSDIILRIYIPYLKTFESPEHCITGVCI